MKTTTNKKTFALNLLIAIVISVVVNFSYFVFIMVNNRQAEVQSQTEVVVEQQSEQPKAVESTDSTKEEVVVREESISRYSRERSGHSNPWFTRKGQVFMWLDMLYYVAVALLLLWIMTTPTRRRKWGYVGRLLVCLALLTLFYFIAPHLTRQGDIIITASARRLFNPMLLLKLSATYIIVVLYGKIFQMHYKQQEIEVENERLKNENLTWQYNTLINQVNPHFLFNSLNSLSMLVREGNKEGALVYIDQMSDTYRYIIQDGTAEMTTVGNELRFLEAYKYLLEIRYAGKLHIEVDVNKALYDYTLPPLSIQPLIENAVKHNTISSSHPMRIDITTEEDYIVVSNTITPKLEAEESTGIGLTNLSHRCTLLTERDIVVENNGSTFIVKLPIAKPDTK